MFTVQQRTIHMDTGEIQQMKPLMCRLVEFLSCYTLDVRVCNNFYLGETPTYLKLFIYVHKFTMKTKIRLELGFMVLNMLQLSVNHYRRNNFQLK